MSVNVCFFVLEGHFGNMNTAIQIPNFMFYTYQ